MKNNESDIQKESLVNQELIEIINKLKNKKLEDLQIKCIESGVEESLVKIGLI